MSANEGSDKDEADNKSIICIMPESVEEETSDLDDALPEKSRIVYNSTYNKFIEWKKGEGDRPLSEQLMLDYFTYLYNVQKRKPSTLWSIYSMLKMTIKTNDKTNIGKYRKLNAYLKEQSIGFESKKTKSLSSSEIESFLNEAPDRKYLAVKVSLIFAIIGACRREELCNITVNDIEDDGTFALIRIRNPETEVERSFTIVDEFYNIYKKYAVLRPKYAKTDRFFMQYTDGKCNQQVIGINKFGSMPKLIASWLKLPDAENYTGHSFRRSSAILLADSGADILSLRANSAFKTKVAKCHAKDSLNRKKRLSEQIMKTVILKPSTSNEPSPTLRPSTALSPATFLVPTSSIPSSSVTSSTSSTSSSTSNFETIYFPVKEECQDDNSDKSPLDINPLRAKDESELPANSGNTKTRSDIRAHQLIKSAKLIKPSVLTSQLRKIAPSSEVPVSAPTPVPPRILLPKATAPVLTASTQQQGTPRTLYLRKVPLKVTPVTSTPVNASPKQPVIEEPQHVISPKSAGVCLRWKSYHSNMQNSFPSLLDSEEFVDVTLACEGKSVKCHKIILSSCSDYLAQLLRENPCPHPIILMKDLKFWEIEALVQFMYKGEIHIPHEKLPQLLNAAKALEIKGLAGFTLSKVQKQPESALQTKPKPPRPTVPEKSSVTKPTISRNSLPKEQTTSLNAKTSSLQLNEKRATKRSLENTEAKPFVKIRLQRTKSPPILRAESPVIKSEPIDIPASPIDNIPDNNYDDTAQNYIDLMEIHEDDDPGGYEQSTIDDRIEQLETKGTDDTDDNEKQMEFISTEFLDDEQDILDVIDHESCRSDLVSNERDMDFVAGDMLEVEQDIDETLGETNTNNILGITDTDTLLEQTVADDDGNEKSKEKDKT